MDDADTTEAYREAEEAMRARQRANAARQFAAKPIRTECLSCNEPLPLFRQAMKAENCVDCQSWLERMGYVK